MIENKLLAEVNGKKIYEDDVFHLLAGIEDKQRFNSKEGFNILTDELVNQELILQNAKENNFDQEDEFRQRLEEVKNDMLKNYAMHKIFNEVTINDDEVLDYYNKNKDTLFSPTTYTASHILVEDENKANKILEEIENGLDFAEAAKKYSLDPSKDNGGSLGTFPKGVMVPEFQEGLDKLSIGEVSKPVKSQFGYHLIKLDDKKVNEQNFEDIKDNVRSTYEMIKRQEKYLELVNDLYKKSEVKKYY
ncbi:peptidylprolyl isomerase [Anaerococcus sp. Marseille-Q7828]|uniref:peptidylprolyl isomerase n=1 Tax=Anaerococcus sp. Marseille-Q7828 TaxID=3036300 RepID=UPI0024AC82A1|nr:peptidylprolyl isomerase [Anaerococcus sp. Marseille-Q7828]